MSEPEVVAQTVMAQRLWRWTPDYGLEGMRKVWTSGFMEADCPRGHESPFWNPDAHDQYLWTPSGRRVDVTKFGERPPEPPCLCGVNAYKLTHLFDPGDLNWARGAEYMDIFRPTQVDALPVLGIVELGGNVHEYEYGYRAQYARIIEGTILTTLPIDSRLLADLETRYDAPFRVQAYDEWKEEWEATYGRDRETETTDQGSEAGEETGSGYTARAVQRTGTHTLTFNLNAAAFQKAYLSTWPVFDEVDESWWEGYKRSWREDWQLGKDLVALRLGANLLFVAGFSLIALTFADLAGWL